MIDNYIKISVLIATRNRPEQFLVALHSVLNQSYSNTEIIVVNDGSDTDSLASYAEIESNCTDKVKFIYLNKRKNGHGPSFARNTAAFMATGQYLAFLDDDDLWTDTELLSRFVATVVAAPQLELYFSNQKAIHADGAIATQSIWLESLIAKTTQLPSVTESAVFATPEWLISANSFAHLNCTIVQTSLFAKLNGFDEALRYEEDKDLFWRLLDNAQVIVFDKNFVALHHIPKQRNSASNDVEYLKKRELQIYIAEKNLLRAQKQEIQALCRQEISNGCKHAADFLYKNQLPHLAFYYAKKALIAKFGFKWALFTIFLMFKK